MIRGYNETPENFGVPSDETIQRVIELADWQMQLDQNTEQNASSVKAKQELEEVLKRDNERLKDPFMAQFVQSAGASTSPGEQDGPA